MSEPSFEERTARAIEAMKKVGPEAWLEDVIDYCETELAMEQMHNEPPARIAHWEHRIVALRNAAALRAEVSAVRDEMRELNNLASTDEFLREQFGRLADLLDVALRGEGSK